MKLELIETLKGISLGLFAMELLKSKKKTTYKIPKEIINEYKFQCEVNCKFLADYSTDYKQNYINYTCWYHKRYLRKKLK